MEQGRGTKAVWCELSGGERTFKQGVRQENQGPLNGKVELPVGVRVSSGRG
ncbi:hypothetical protein [Streptomyces sp. NPDC018000]|uniref:hypothetical protein n=1 Tax=Streptomyces sp. NPDC018000 TaxID=3365028 RepID=UPI0037A3C9E7